MWRRASILAGYYLLVLGWLYFLTVSVTCDAGQSGIKTVLVVFLPTFSIWCIAPQGSVDMLSGRFPDR